MPNLYLAKAYLQYRLHAIGKHRIHSPFVFKLVTDVFPENENEPEDHPAEVWRTECLLNNRVLNVVDLGTGRSGPRTISNIADKSSKSDVEGQLLHRIVKHFKPKRMLELGTSLGITTIYQATATDHDKFISLEGCPETAEVARKYLAANGYRVEVRTGNFDDTLHGALRELGKVDYVFFDGNHTEQATLRYFESCLVFAHNGTVFIFDDIHWSKGMERAWEKIMQNESVRLSLDLFDFGMAFIRQEQKEKQHFVVKY